ncbi:MAG TPA: DUF6515 family protein [Candidatus Acidoferrum sp.]|nr:DUF6515 family protein [Candidatus Acidoferrum sp.]
MKSIRSQWSLRAAQTILLCAISAAAFAQPHRGPEHGEPLRGQVFDHRFNHDHYYPARGAVIAELPRERVSVVFRGTPYYFHGGAWYRADRGRYIVVAPPIGLVVPILPPFYTTLWMRGVPYYYANDAYYLWSPQQNGYVITEPPANAETIATSTVNDDLYVYPTKNQTEAQQSTDRYECYRWAADQTGFDPTQPPKNLGAADMDAKRANYHRAETACLQGRGYSVK